MCIIVDANKLGTFVNPEDENSAPIRRWLEKGGQLVYSTGGRFATEVGQRARQQLAVYARAGRAALIPHSAFADDEERLRKHVALRSDDAHVLALARSSGARLLYTEDRALMDDFKDKKIVDSPRGRIYSNAANANLLTRSTCPRQAP